MTTPRHFERIWQNAPADFEAETRPRTRAKRQKVEHTETKNVQQGQIVRPQRPDKYIRGRRGHLELIAEMPLDTLHEIFRQLDPIDLLHLSWASKSLHGIIMEKSFIYIWEEAYQRLYECENPPPRCPRDMNFAQYTRFLYYPKCMVCDTRPGIYTSWMMRMRACKRCLDSDLFFPCDDTPFFLTICGKDSRYILTSDLEEAKKPINWRKRQKLVNNRMEGTSEFNLWETRYSQILSDLEDLRRAQREIAVFKKLEEIGWTKSYIKEINHGWLPDNLPGLGTVKKLTDREWARIRPKIESILSGMKESHLFLLKQKRLNKRWRQFKDTFQEWEEAQTLGASFRPRPLDIVVVEPFFTAVFKTDTEVAKFKIDDIDRIAKEWIEWRDDFVFSVLPQDLQDRYRANELWRQPLAILWFSHPWNGMLDEICGYREDIYDCIPQSPDESQLSEAIIELGLYSGPWKWSNQNLKFDTKCFEVTRDILELVEMDPYTTTMSQVRECKLTFSCSLCKNQKRLTCEEMIVHDLTYREGEEQPLPSAWWILAQDEDNLGCETA